MVKRSVGAAGCARPAEGNKRKKAGEWDGRRRRAEGLRREELAVRGARWASAFQRAACGRRAGTSPARRERSKQRPAARPAGAPDAMSRSVAAARRHRPRGIAPTRPPGAAGTRLPSAPPARWPPAPPSAARPPVRLQGRLPRRPRPRPAGLSCALHHHGQPPPGSRLSATRRCWPASDRGGLLRYEGALAGDLLSSGWRQGNSPPAAPVRFGDRLGAGLARRRSALPAAINLPLTYTSSAPPAILLLLSLHAQSSQSIDNNHS